MLNVRGAIFVHVGAYFRIRENESGVENINTQKAILTWDYKLGENC